MFPKHTLKLNGTALRALDWWLRYVIEQVQVKENYYVVLMALTLSDVYQRKVYPKTAIVKPETSVKLSPQETLALFLSFSRYDYFDAPQVYQPHLYFISEGLPRVRREDEQFIPPQLNSNYGGE